MPIFLELSGTSPKFPVLELSAVTGGVSVVSSAGGGAGKAEFADVSVTLNYDPTLPILFLDAADGVAFQTVVLIFKEGSNSNPSLVIQLSTATISSLEISANTDVPFISLSFGYQQIEMTSYTAAGTTIYSATVQA
jgi:type VI protein secretion system component Hcp